MAEYFPNLTKLQTHSPKRCVNPKNRHNQTARCQWQVRAPEGNQRKMAGSVQVSGWGWLQVPHWEQDGISSVTA